MLDLRRYTDNVTVLIAIFTFLFSFIFFFKDTFYFFSSLTAALITTALVTFTVLMLKWLSKAVK